MLLSSGRGTFFFIKNFLISMFTVFSCARLTRTMLAVEVLLLPGRLRLYGGYFTQMLPLCWTPVLHVTSESLFFFPLKSKIQIRGFSENIRGLSPSSHTLTPPLIHCLVPCAVPLLKMSLQSIFKFTNIAIHERCV